KLIGDHSLFQMTLRRFTGPEFAAPLVMTENEFRFMATEQCAQIGLADAQIIAEPSRRDTAPAILAAALLLQDQPDAFML
ncbi:sugar phosphate nucleotidyltransferase, partial [Sulfitobacter sp. HI0076]